MPNSPPELRLIDGSDVKAPPFEVNHHIRKGFFADAVLYTARVLTDSQDELAPVSFSVLEPDEQGKVAFTQSGVSIKVNLEADSTVIEVLHKSQSHFRRFMELAVHKTMPYLEQVSKMEALKNEGVLNGYYIPQPNLSTRENQG